MEGCLAQSNTAGVPDYDDYDDNIDKDFDNDDGDDAMEQNSLVR